MSYTWAGSHCLALIASVGLSVGSLLVDVVVVVVVLVVVVLVVYTSLERIPRNVYARVKQW